MAIVCMATVIISCFPATALAGEEKGLREAIEG